MQVFYAVLTEGMNENLRVKCQKISSEHENTLTFLADGVASITSGLHEAL